MIPGFSYCLNKYSNKEHASQAQRLCSLEGPAWPAAPGTWPAVRGGSPPTPPRACDTPRASTSPHKRLARTTRSSWRTAPCTTTRGTRTAQSMGTATPRTPPAPPGHTAPNPHLARSSINFYWGNIGPILQVKRGKSKVFRLKVRKSNLLKMYQAV